jgi:hypothetical protein
LTLAARPVEIDPAMKQPTAGERKHRCTRKRRYRTQGDALDAALIAGVARARTAYRCPLCGFWHLTSR